MIYNVENAKVGDKVFKFEYSEFPQIVTVSRRTNNFVFIERKNMEGKTWEEKYRLDGSIVEEYSKSRLVTIEPGDIEKLEKEKSEKARIHEIRNLLNDKGFSFNGYNQWYTLEQWEILASAFKK